MNDESSDNECDLCDYEREGIKCCCCSKIVCHYCHPYHKHKDCVHDTDDIKEILECFIDVLKSKLMFADDDYNPYDDEYDDKIEKLKTAFDIVKKL